LQSLKQASVPALWKLGYTGEHARVGVIGTGVDLTHPDFRYNHIEALSLVGGNTNDNLGHETGVVSFDTYCQQHGIKHILGGIGKPTTQGKIERWFRTYDLEHARFQLHRKFIEYYNYERPHMALNYSRPAQVYFGSVPHVMV